MIKLPKNHPFISSAQRLEILEAREGATPELIKRRFMLKKRFPEYFDEYMKAKMKKESIRLCKEKAVKEIQIRKYGSETVSYHKNKIQEQKKNNYLKRKRNE
jgi:hypothetical protein